MLIILRGRSTPSGSSNIKQIKYGSVTTIPFPDNMFNLLVSGDVLEHVKDDDKAVQEFRRVLKQDGTCVSLSLQCHHYGIFQMNGQGISGDIQRKILSVCLRKTALL